MEGGLPPRALARDQHTCFQAEDEKMHPDRKQSLSWARDSLPPPTLLQSTKQWEGGGVVCMQHRCGAANRRGCRPELSQLLAVTGSVM